MLTKHRQVIMINNNFKIAFSSLLAQKWTAIINIFGLAMGMTCFIVIMLYVKHELSYDKFHTDSDRIYRIVKDVDNKSISHSRVPPALLPTILNEVPEVESGVRLFQWNSGQLSYKDKVIHETSNLYVENSFFEVFSFPFISGDFTRALTDPMSIVLTNSMAKKLFGDDKAIGKTISFKNQNRRKKYLVTGVIQDIPSQSHFKFDFLLPSKALPYIKRANSSWDDTEINAHTYIKAKQGTSSTSIAEKIQDIVKVNKTKNTYTYSTQKLSGLNGIHLTSHRSGELQANSNKLYIKVLLIIAFFVILIAGINYVNLATAKSATRAKEVGVKKVFGAKRVVLISQFLTESLLIATLAGGVAICITGILLPYFNSVVNKDLSLFSYTNISIWFLSIGVIVILGILAGLYPAFYLSSLKPVLVLKKNQKNSKSSFGIRRALVVAQFSLATILIVGLIIIQKQLNYVQSVNLGINKEQVIIISNGWQLPKRDKSFIFRNELKKLSGVLEVGSGKAIGAVSENGSFHKFRSKASDKIIEIKNVEGDQGFINVFGIKLIEGSNLSPIRSLKDFKLILNETAVKQLNLKAPIVGQKIEYIRGDQSYQVPISGVMKDFHLSSLHTEIHPIYLSWRAEALTIAVKLNNNNIQESLKQIEEVWDKHTSNAPMDFYFLDKSIDDQYKSEQNFRTIFSSMTALGLLLACLGLFGLVAYSAEQRSKEISIRKVLGAPVTSLLALLTREFSLLILISIMISWPIAYYVMKKWLENFAYKIDIEFGTFLMSVFFIMTISILTTGYQIFKASLTNPIKSLRTE